jgi:CRP-like cAMP-binding protein
LAHVYFPTRGLCGIVSQTDRQGVDVASLGCEGMTGVFGFADRSASSRVVVHMSPGEALFLPIERFDEEMDRREEFRDLVTQYYRAVIAEVVESVACQRLHSTEQRFCRRLLTIADRLGSDTFGLTHDLMASMLGIQRPAVSAMALAFKHLGAIAYRRGKVTILDREALEIRACGCYRAAHSRIAHLLPPRA